MSSLRTLGFISRQYKRYVVRLTTGKSSIIRYNSCHCYRSVSRSNGVQRKHRMLTHIYSLRMCQNRPSSNDIDVTNDTDDQEEYKWRAMPKIRDFRYWDKYEWIYTCASLIQFIGFMSYDLILLRTLSLLSASGLMVAHTGRKFFVGWFWAFSFATANIIALYLFLREKYSGDISGLTEEESFIFSLYFEPFGITPLEYKQIIKIAHFTTMIRGETLTISGLISDKVFLLLSGQCLVINDESEAIGVISTGSQKSFVGEIALIDDTQDVATATVKTNSEKTRVLYWDVEELKYLLKNAKAPFRVKLINVFTASMKIKLMDFNANFNVEKSIEFKQQNLESVVQILLIAKGKLKIAENDVDKYEFLTEENEKIELCVDEQMFLSEYVKQKQINDEFTDKLMKKYHIDIAVSRI